MDDSELTDKEIDYMVNQFKAEVWFEKFMRDDSRQDFIRERSALRTAIACSDWMGVYEGNKFFLIQEYFKRRLLG